MKAKSHIINPVIEALLIDRGIDVTNKTEVDAVIKYMKRDIEFRGIDTTRNDVVTEAAYQIMNRDGTTCSRPAQLAVKRAATLASH